MNSHSRNRWDRRGRTLLHLLASATTKFNMTMWLLTALVLAILDAALMLIPMLLLKNIVDHAILHRRTSDLVVPLLLFAMLTVGKALVSAYSYYWIHCSGEKLNLRLGDGLVAVVRDLPFDTRIHIPTGGFASRVVNDCLQVSVGVTGTVGRFLDSIVLVGSGLAVLLYLNWQLTCISLAVLLIALLPARISNRRLSALTREYVDAMTSLSSQLTEHLCPQGMLLASVSGAGAAVTGELSAATMRLSCAATSRSRVQAQLNGVLGMLDAAGSLSVLGIGAVMVAYGDISIGVLAVFALYLFLLYSPAMRILEAPGQFQTTLGAAERVWQLLSLGESVHRIDERRSSELLLSGESGQSNPSLTPGTVEVRDLSFAYRADSDLARRLGLSGEPDNKSDLDNKGDDGFAVQTPMMPGSEVARVATAIDRIDLTVQAGEHAVIEGPSGAGKSTLLLLLAGLLTPSHGTVRIGGQDIRSVDPERRAELVYLVSQDSFLFRRSIRDNLTFGLRDLSDDSLRQACVVANAEAIVESLPRGFDTIVGEEGRSLSGGERQRLALARALLRSPQVLLLDEPTAHLDPDSEAEVRAGLEEAARGRTVIVVSHRGSPLRDIGRLFRLEGGRLVGERRIAP